MPGSSVRGRAQARYWSVLLRHRGLAPLQGWNPESALKGELAPFPSVAKALPISFLAAFRRPGCRAAGGHRQAAHRAAGSGTLPSGGAPLPAPLPWPLAPAVLLCFCQFHLGFRRQAESHPARLVRVAWHGALEVPVRGGRQRPALLSSSRKIPLQAHRVFLDPSERLLTDARAAPGSRPTGTVLPPAWGCKSP